MRTRDRRIQCRADRRVRRARLRRCRRYRTQNRKTAGYRADLAGHQLLSEDDDGRECRGQDQTDQERQNAYPLQIDVGQKHREWRNPQDGTPDDAFAADTIADRPPQKRTQSHRQEKHEQMNLRRTHAHVELLDEVEAVEARDARDVEVLRENEKHQDADRPCDAARRHGTWNRRPRLRGMRRSKCWRLYHPPTLANTAMASMAASVNQIRLV